MIQICLVISLVIISQGQMVKGHALPLPATVSQTNGTQRRLSKDPDFYRAFEMDMDESSGMTLKDWPEQEDPSLQCDGMSSDITIRTIFTESDQNGCYLFETPGFDGSGYPNAGGGLTKYDCRFVARFQGDSVSGTVTVPAADFDFQPKNGNTCIDRLTISNLTPLAADQPADDDSLSNTDSAILYCGTIQEDKVYNFNMNFVTIRLTADDTVRGTGAKVIICFP